MIIPNWIWKILHIIKWITYILWIEYRLDIIVQNQKALDNRLLDLINKIRKYFP